MGKKAINKHKPMNDMKDCQYRNRQSLADLEFEVELMIECMPLMFGYAEDVKDEVSRLLTWVTMKIGRDMTNDEMMNFVQGLLKYYQTEEETPERMTAMKYLFEMKFLNQ